MNAVQQYFYALSFIAVLLLWGNSVINGTVWALLKTSWTQKLPDGTPFHTNYTGLILLDFPVSLLVGFFYYGTNGHDAGYQLFLFNGYGLLQCAYVWLYAELARKGGKVEFLQSPLFFGLLWQMLGGAISLPLFYAAHELWDVTNKAIKPTQLNTLLALPGSYLFAAVIPVCHAMLPGYLGTDIRTPKDHQSALAAFQPDPVWVELAILGGSGFMSQLTMPRYGDLKRCQTWASRAYLVSAIVSASGWIYMLWTVAISTDQQLGFSRMFVPQSLSGNAEGILVGGPWVFLQFDIMIIGLSSLSWAFLQAIRTGKAEPKILVAYMALGTAVLGPGATTSLLLRWREQQLEYSEKDLGDIGTTSKIAGAIFFSK